MVTRHKGKKSAVSADKNKDLHRHMDANASDPEGSRDDDEEEKLVNLTLILKEIRDFRQDNRERLGEIRGELSKTNLRVDEAEARIVENEERLQNAEAVMAEMLKLHEQLQVRVMDQESCSRSESMRIYGI